MTAHARPESPPSDLVHAAKQRLLAALRGDAPQPDAAPTLPVAGEPAATDHVTAWPGEVAVLAPADDDRYEFGEAFAAGGLGLVRKARDRRLGRTVAVKELLRSDPEAERRFALEAAITARLQHPSIIPLYDMGRRPDGAPYYCMKLIDGESLEHGVRRCKTLAERVALLEHVIAAADAVAHAHRNGVIHRDLKPANILVGERGETVVIDWGLAKDTTGAAAEEARAESVGSDHNSLLTAHGTVLGTLRYMSPEQARGEVVDARGDVYSLGAVLFHVLAGVAPFEGVVSQMVVARLCEGKVERLAGLVPDAPRELVAITERAMAPRREDRYPTAEAFAEDLRRFRTGRLVDAHRYSTGEVMRRWLRRHRAVATVAASSLLALAGVGAVAVQNIREERDRAEDASVTATQAQHSAEEALVAARAQAREARLAQARGALETDLTASLAALAQVDMPDETTARRVRLLALAAESRGAPTRVLRGHTRPIAQVVALVGGELVSVDIAGAVFRWDPSTGRGAQVLDARDPQVTLVAAREAPVFAAVTETKAHVVRGDGSLEVLDVSIVPPGFHRTPKYEWDLSAGGETLAALGDAINVGDGPPAFLWDLKARPAAVSQVPGVRAGVAALRPDGRAVAYELKDRTVAVWEAGESTKLAGMARALGYSSSGAHVFGFPGGEPRMASVTPGAADAHELGRWLLGVAADDRALAIVFDGFTSSATLSLRSLATGDAVWERDFDSESLSQWRGTGDYFANVDPRGDGLAIRVRDHWLLGSLATGELPRRVDSGAFEQGAWYAGGFALARVDELWLWDSPAGSPTPAPTRSYAALARDGAREVSRTRSQEFALRDVSSGAELAAPCLVGQHTARSRRTHFELDAQGRLLVTGEQGVCLQDAAGVAHRIEVSGAPVTGALADRGEGFAVGFEDGAVMRWGAVGASPESLSLGSGILGLTVVPGGGVIARAHHGHIAAIGAGEPVRLDAGQGTKFTAGRAAVAVHPREPVAAVALPGEDIVVVRDLAAGSQHRRAVSLPAFPALAYSREGQLAVSVGGHAVLVLDGRGEGSARELRLPEQATSLAWIGEFELALVGDQGSLMRADVATGEAVVVRRGFSRGGLERGGSSGRGGELRAAPTGAVALYEEDSYSLTRGPDDVVPRDPAALSQWLGGRVAVLGRQDR